MALGQPRSRPQQLRLHRGAATSLLLVYREGLLLAPRVASLRSVRGVPGGSPSAIRLDAFQRMLRAELQHEVEVGRLRRGVLAVSASPGSMELARALRFARMLGLSGWASRAGSFARLNDPKPSDVDKVLTLLRRGETSRATLVRGHDVMELHAAPDGARLELAERSVHDLDLLPRVGARACAPSLRHDDAGHAVWQWVTAVACTCSLEVRLSPPTPRPCFG